MNNPWAALQPAYPYALASDYPAIQSFNRGVEDVHKVHLELLPEPFLGSPEAEVFLLNLNPGYSELDLPFYEQPAVQEMWRKNILHQPQEYPFYLLDPRIAEESGPRWWAQKLKEPIALAGRKRVASRVCCVEFFPYHSRRFRPNPTLLESQRYSFSLVERAAARNRPIILMRGERYWLEAVPALKQTPHLYRLRSAQNVAISRNNCPEGFEVLARTLLE